MSTGFTFRPAVREQTPLWFGVVGPSSSGKTYSALRIATGMQQVIGGDIGFIDTEQKRALRYADYFKFKHLHFTAPFGSARYLAAMEAAVKEGCRIICVDSMSHEHEGVGGYLETHEAEMQRMAGDNYGKRERVKFAAWIKPAAERRKLINGMLQTVPACVVCFRAKEKLRLVKDAEGKTVPVSQGWQPIAGEEFYFEMMAACVLPPRSGGVPDMDAQATKIEKHHMPAFKPGQPLSEETGRWLAEWNQGKRPEAKPEPKAAGNPAGDPEPPPSSVPAAAPPDQPADIAGGYKRKIDAATRERIAAIVEEAKLDPDLFPPDREIVIAHARKRYADLGRAAA